VNQWETKFSTTVGVLVMSVTVLVNYKTNSGVEGTLNGAPDIVAEMLEGLKNDGDLKCLNWNGTGWVTELPTVKAPVVMSKPSKGVQRPLLAPSYASSVANGADGSQGTHNASDAGHGQPKPYKGRQRPLPLPTTKF
jgi:hypothetical protein